MKRKLLISSKSVIDVEVFSTLENYLSYIGYPWDDIISQQEAFLEDGTELHFYIDREKLKYVEKGIDQEKLRTYLVNYISCFKIKEGCLDAYSNEDFIDLIISFRGITF